MKASLASRTIRADVSATNWGVVKNFFLAISLLLIVASPTIVLAGGFRIFDHSASATAQGGAFMAQADDPSAIYFNPAGMTQLSGIQTSAGTLLVGGHTTFTSSFGPAAGSATQGDFLGSISFPPPSNFYITANLKGMGIPILEKFSAGIGVISPFGLGYQYSANHPIATASMRQSLPLIDIKPTLAFRLNDQLSFGIGADIYTFAPFLRDGEMSSRFVSAGGFVPPGAQVEVNGNDTALGFNVSMLYTPMRNAEGKPLINLGLVYRTQATLHLDGQFLVNGARLADASTTLVLPQVFTGGLAVWPIRNAEREWKLELDVDYTGWKSVRGLDVHLSNGLPPIPPNGLTIPFPQNWRSVYTIMIGTEYKWLQLAPLPDWEIALRGGYWHSQTPVPDVSFSPTIPDSDQHAISAGVGLLCKGQGRFFGVIPCGVPGGPAFLPKAIGLDLAYQVILYEPRTVTGNQQPLTNGDFVEGLYQTTYHVGSINLRFKF